MKKDKPKIIYLRVDEELKMVIRVSAAMCGITTQKWVLRAIAEKILKDKTVL